MMMLMKVKDGGDVDDDDDCDYRIDNTDHDL